MVDSEPVVCDFILSILQGNAAIANLVMQVIFHFILFVEAGLGVGRFWPKIGNIIGTAQFQRNEMVHLILAGGVGKDPIFGIGLGFN